MPTGYTSYIQDDKINSGKEFILLYARAFGATISMRDEALGVPIPQFEPDNFYKEYAEHAKEKLNQYQNITTEEAQKLIDEQHAKKIETVKKLIKERQILKNKYLKVLQEVKEWQPPTDEHINLKKYAVEQIEDTIEFDCDIEYYEQDLKDSKKENPKEWLEYMIEHSKEDIDKYTKDYQAEVDRTNERNKWIEDLKNSLK